MSEFQIVERPNKPRGAITRALHETLTNGKALRFAVPEGVEYAVYRNRKASGWQGTARRLNARVRTARADDGSVLIWFEPKNSEAAQ